VIANPTDLNPDPNPGRPGDEQAESQPEILPQSQVANDLNHPNDNPRDNSTNLPDPLLLNPLLPDLSPRLQSLLDLYIESRFDLFRFAAAARLTSRALAEFAASPASPAIRAHLDSLSDLARRSLAMRAMQARHTAINTLEALAEKADDDIEKRRAASQLLRATSSPIAGAPASSRADQPRPSTGDDAPDAEADSDEDPDDDPDEDEPDESLLPLEVPHPKFTAEQVAALLGAALTHEDAVNAAPATLTAFSDGPLVIDQTVLSDAEPSADAAKAINAVRAGALKPYIVLDQFHTLESFTIQPAPPTPEGAAETTIVMHIKYHTTWNYSLERNFTRPLTLRLTRRADSDPPNCWLIASITTGDRQPVRSG